MKGFERQDLLFSLCGLNCGLCPMQWDGHCPGCGGGAGNQSCKIARCALEHGGPAYCFQCGDYPCGRLCGGGDYDSFITHQRRQADLERARVLGPEACRAGISERREILGFLLENCNDGRRKTLFFLAANLLELPVLERIRARAEAMADRSLKERAAAVSGELLAAAGEAGVTLKLRRKPKTPPPEA